ncbi:ABC transporter substrate-binding protein [Alkalihalobacillus sp. BA299]|uniref:ABC transporter substrate-binding protein n=1 Tax=Alkalihalobacillus sp. BA299 TaxID=2815938 RepID=UPI001AD988DD|nr:ABC transporter substrate-binding protein [Alkalihalobacillus sp. BA299]
MKLKKRSGILMALLLVLMLVIAGCGGTPADSENNNNSNEDASNETSNNVETVKLGVVLATTGPIATTGTWTLDGHQMAVKEINENGGFQVGDKTYNVEIVHYDSEGRAESATRATERLINQDKVVAVLGTSISSETAAMIPIAERAQTPLATFVAASDVLTEQGASYFSHAAPANINYVDAGTQTVKDIGMSNIAIIYVDDAWGQSYARLYPEKLEAAGINIATTEAFAPEQSEFITLLNKVKSTNPDGILLAAETELAVPLLVQIRETMGEIPIMETGGVIPEEVLRLEPEVAEGLVTLSRSGEETEEIRNFKEMFEADYDYEANSFVYSGWDGIHLIVDALERAGTVTDKQAINDAIRASNYPGLIGTYSFNERGENKLTGNRAIVKDGAVIYQSVDTPLP